MYGHKHKRYRVVEAKSSVMRDYASMNYHAAKALGFNDVKMHPNMILVDKRLSQKQKKATIRHEIIEDRLMSKGAPYWKAHKFALKHEVK